MQNVHLFKINRIFRHLNRKKKNHSHNTQQTNIKNTFTQNIIDLNTHTQKTTIHIYKQNIQNVNCANDADIAHIDAK